MFSGWLPAQSIVDYPEIDQVIEHFYRNYQGNQPDNQVITFARKADGWYIQQQPYGESDQVIDSEILWSIQTQSYLPLRYPKLPVNSSPNIAYHTSRYFNITNWSAYDYQRCLFYGYPRWATDMVNTFGETENLSEQNLEGLSRAYDFLANQVLYSTYGIPHPSYQPLEGQRLTDQGRLENYLRYMDGSIACLEALVEKAPEYELLVGTPRVKLASQFMTAWTHLIGAGLPELAQKYALQADYDEFTSRLSAFQLDALPANARFVSFGDNDFFPLLALQVQQQRRTDVTIVNYQLLNASWYFNLMKDSLDISFPNAQLDQLRKGYMVLQGQPDSIRLRVAGSTEMASMATNKSGMSRYLLANQLVVNQLVEKSKPNQPLCFSWFGDLSLFDHLSNFLSVSGMTYELSTRPARHGQSDPMMQQMGYLNLDSASAIIDSLIAADLSWFTTDWDSDQSSKLFGTAFIRYWVTVLYHHSLLLNNVASETEEDVANRDQLVFWARALEAFFDEPDILLAESAAEMAIIGYKSNMEWMGEEWEKRMYNCLDQVQWDKSSRKDLDVRRGLLALEIMGYFYQESGRDVQRITLEQELGKYEARLTDY